MWIQVSLIIILCIFIIIAFFVHKQRIDYRIYQVNDQFDHQAPSDPLYQPFNELFIPSQHIQDADVIIFSDYGQIDKYLGSLTLPTKTKFVYAIQGSDLLASKSNLARHFQNHNQHSFIPNTIIFGEHDTANLPKGIYFLKQNIQRQEGNLITDDTKYISQQAYQDGYVVCQELLQDPFLVNQRKINMRVYLLITSYNNDTRFYYYNNGFMYYTPKHFKKDSKERDENITTGYIDRQVYIDNPLTHHDLYKFLDKEQSKTLKNNMHNLFTTLKNIYKNEINILNKDTIQYRFNIFGVDVAPDVNLDVKIMEVNKAPDLSYKDERDSAVKFNMVQDALTIVKLSKKGNPKNFVLVD